MRPVVIFNRLTKNTVKSTVSTTTSANTRFKLSSLRLLSFAFDRRRDRLGGCNQWNIKVSPLRPLFRSVTLFTRRGPSPGGRCPRARHFTSGCPRPFAGTVPNAIGSAIPPFFLSAGPLTARHSINFSRYACQNVI